LIDYAIRSHDLQNIVHTGNSDSSKRGSLMGYVSRSCDLMVMGFPFLVFLMAYISRSCDLIDDGISKKGKF